MIESFVIFMLIFLGIGLYAMRHSKHTTADYLVAGQSVRPWLTALSAVATNNSGYMFIGMIGYTYQVGLASVWLMVGWIVGDFLASLFIHRRVREESEARDAHSFGGLLSHWHGNDYYRLRVVIGILTLIFLGAYASAQLTAGSKVLHALLGWDYHVGALLGAVMILAYSFAGGIRASIWTDAAQSLVMLTAMGVMLVSAVESLGGIDRTIASLAAVSPTYMQWFPEATVPGAIGFVAGWLIAGFGVAGQPHIMVRFMAMNDPGEMMRVRLYYYGWFTLFYGMTIGVGLAARTIMASQAGFDPELALPLMARHLLPDVFAGLVLAGIFAAAMSTADSLVLSCSAAFTRDFTRKKHHSYRQTKLATLGIVLFALLIAVGGVQSVFSLVLDAWAVMGAAFVPLLAVYALGGRPDERLAIAMVLGGVTALYLWKFLLPGVIYEIVPGMAAGIMIYFVGWKTGVGDQTDSASK